MKPVKIVHLLGTAGVGGIERQLLLILDALDERFDNELILFRGGPLLEQFQARVPTAVLEKRHKLAPIWMGHLIRELRRRSPHVVQTWGVTPNLWGPLAARLAGVPRTVIAEAELDEWKGIGRSAIDRANARLVHAVVGNARAVTDAVARRGVAKELLRVVPYAVFPGEYHRPQPVPGRILLVGRIHPRKGHGVLVDALADVMAEVPDAHLAFAGGAWLPEEKEFEIVLKEKVSNHPFADRIEFLGNVADPGQAMQEASVVVLPSTSEGLPNVLLEAMAWEAPVVASAVGGIPEVLEHEVNGLLVPPEDPAALAGAIIKVLKGPSRARERVERARELVLTKHSPEAVAARWGDLYDEILASRAG